MLKRIRAALNARSTVLVLLVLVGAAMTVAAVVPQRGLVAMASGAAAPGAAPRPGRWVEVLGLDHVFSTHWFAALALVFVASLTLSTLEQFRVARARMRHLPAEAGAAGETSPLARGNVEAMLRREGFRRLSAAPGRSRYVRHWHGYWGSFLLHAGMTLTVLSSLTYVLTEHRAKLHVASGRPLLLERDGLAVQRGLLAREIPVPSEVHLHRVEPTFGANDQLVDVASHLIFTDARGVSREVRVAVNDYQDYLGIVVYQLVKYGNAFFLEVDDGAGAAGELLLELAYPEKRGAASYGSRPLAGPWMLKAKYYASADRTELLPKDPQLVLRLYEGERLVDEATLQEGQAARVGPLQVRLARVGWWTEILLEGSVGTSGIFAGFAVLLLGGALTFFAVPREVIVQTMPDGCAIRWSTTRFDEMYREERARILAQCTGGQST